MIAVIQRVERAQVSIESHVKAVIQNGLLVLLGVASQDTQEDIVWIAKKIIQMRIFADAEGKMNLSVQEIKGEILLVSQFTLLANTKKGNRPSFTEAARPEIAMPIYEQSIKVFEQILGRPIRSGTFGANMQIELLNDGPVTIILDSKTP